MVSPGDKFRRFPVSDEAKRFIQNPLLRPKDLKPSTPGLVIECLLNPGVFRFNGKTCLIVRVAERPLQKEGIISFPVLSAGGTMTIKEIRKDDPELNADDPRVINYKGSDYLTTLSHLRVLESTDGIHFTDTETILMGEGELETFGIEDCRVSQIDETYYLTFTSVSESGVGVGMKTTRGQGEDDRSGERELRKKEKGEE